MTNKEMRDKLKKFPDDMEILCDTADMISEHNDSDVTYFQIEVVKVEELRPDIYCRLCCCNNDGDCEEDCTLGCDCEREYIVLF